MDLTASKREVLLQ